MVFFLLPKDVLLTWINVERLETGINLLGHLKLKTILLHIEKVRPHWNPLCWRLKTL